MYDSFYRRSFCLCFTSFFFFPVWMLFTAFSWLIALANISKSVQERRSESAFSALCDCILFLSLTERVAVEFS